MTEGLPAGGGEVGREQKMKPRECDPHRVGGIQKMYDFYKYLTPMGSGAWEIKTYG